MNETVLFTVSLLLSMLVGFLLGIILCNRREKGLASNSELCGNLTSSIEGSKERITTSEERITDSESRITELLDTGGDIEAIFRKYSEATPEDKNLE